MLVATSLLAISVWANTNSLTITADHMDYNGITKIATAKGNVVVINGENMIKGDEGVYNMNTQMAQVTGNVVLSGPSLSGHAYTVTATQDGVYTGSGNAYFQKDGDSIAGDYVVYNTNTGYGEAENGTVVNDGMAVSANKITAWMKKIEIIGDGNVKMDSEKDSFHATGNHVVYTQTPEKKDGVAILTGNVFARQNENTLRGPRVIVNMEKETVVTNERSTLVLQQ